MPGGHCTSPTQSSHPNRSHRTRQIVPSQRYKNASTNQIPVAAVWAGIAEGAHHLVDCRHARFRSATRERIPPGSLARPVPGVGVGAVAALAMVLAFFDRAVLVQRADRPALQRAIGRRAAEACVANGAACQGVSNRCDPLIMPISVKTTARAAELRPLLALGRSPVRSVAGTSALLSSLSARAM